MSPASSPRAGSHRVKGARDSSSPGRARDACAAAPPSISPCRLGRVKLVAAAHADHVGDRRQATAVAKETLRALAEAELCEPERISYESLTISGLIHAEVLSRLKAAHEQCVDRLQSGEYTHVIFVVSGSDLGFASALARLPSAKGLTTVFTGHKITQDIKEADRLPTITALPASAALTKEERAALESKTKLVQVSGVAHDLNDDTIADAVRQYQANHHQPLPTVDRDTVSILLGGDVVDDKGRLQGRISEEDARKQARGIARLELGASGRRRFIVVSSPRTGKFEADGTPREPNPHRQGRRDTVTQAVEDTLRGYPNTEVHVFDFQYRETPSAYIPLLDAHRKAGGVGRIHVPGDSVSMVSEVASVLPGAMVIDETASMDNGHQHEVDAIAAESGIAVLRRDGELRPGKGTAATSPVPAARRIADAIVAHLAATGATIGAAPASARQAGR